MKEIIRPTYIYEGKCKVCKAKDKAGENVRDQVDAMIAKGRTYRDMVEWMKGIGIAITIQAILRHIKKHSPYVLKAKHLATRRSYNLQKKIDKEFRDAGQALQRIISIGDEMVENWYDNTEGPQMPVSENLYIQALKEQSKREKLSRLDKLLENMDKSWIEGEVVEEGEEKNDRQLAENI